MNVQSWWTWCVRDRSAAATVLNNRTLRSEVEQWAWGATVGDIIQGDLQRWLQEAVDVGDWNLQWLLLTFHPDRIFVASGKVLVLDLRPMVAHPRFVRLLKLLVSLGWTRSVKEKETEDGTGATVWRVIADGNLTKFQAVYHHAPWLIVDHADRHNIVTDEARERVEHRTSLAEYCAHEGHLLLLQWILARQSVVGRPESQRRLMNSAARHLSILQWVFDTFGVCPDDECWDQALERGAGLETVQWIAQHNTGKVAMGDTIGYLPDTILNEPLFDWIYRLSGETMLDEYTIKSCLRTCLRHGDLRRAKWFFNNFSQNALYQFGRDQILSLNQQCLSFLHDNNLIKMCSLTDATRSSFINSMAMYRVMCSWSIDQLMQVMTWFFSNTVDEWKQAGPLSMKEFVNLCCQPLIVMLHFLEIFGLDDNIVLPNIIDAVLRHSNPSCINEHMTLVLTRYADRWPLKFDASHDMDLVDDEWRCDRQWWKALATVHSHHPTLTLCYRQSIAALLGSNVSRLEWIFRYCPPLVQFATEETLIQLAPQCSVQEFDSIVSRLAGPVPTIEVALACLGTTREVLKDRDPNLTLIKHLVEKYNLVFSETVILDFINLDYGSEKSRLPIIQYLFARHVKRSISVKECRSAISNGENEIVKWMVSQRPSLARPSLINFARKQDRLAILVFLMTNQNTI